MSSASTAPAARASRVDPAYDITNRNKRSVLVDLKAADGAAQVLDLVERADVLIEGYRPGRRRAPRRRPRGVPGPQPPAGLRPDDRLGPGRPARRHRRARHRVHRDHRHPRHDRHRPTSPPAIPANLVGDYAGGSLYLVVGVLAALQHARSDGGSGQVVDAAIVDGTAHLSAMIHGMMAAGGWQDRRGANLLDGGCPFYGTYETADGGHMAVGALEQQFYDEFVELLGIEDQAPARKDLAALGRAARRPSPPASRPVPATSGRPSSRAPTPAWRPSSRCARPPPTRISRPAAPSSTTAGSPSPRPRPASPRPPAAVRSRPPSPARTPRRWPATGTSPSLRRRADRRRPPATGRRKRR